MSSISSISGGSSLYSFLQNLSATTESQTAAPTTATTDASTAASATAPGSLEGAHHHHGHGKGGQSQLFQQIQQAVTTALQSAQQNGSANPNQTIEDAIASVFKNHTAAAQQQTAAGGQTTPDADGDTAGSPNLGAAAGAGNSGAIAAFFQSLQSLGIDPQQFHQDLLAAVQGAQNGNSVDPSSLFRNVPLGSVVDTLG